MPVGEFDSTAATEELPPFEARRVGGLPDVFSGRARPVVLSDLDLALIEETDDPRALPSWLQAPDRGDVDGERRSSVASFLAHGAVVMILVIPAMLMVAFGIAAAAR